MISLAIIVRNEERTLDRCLASVAGAVDEIVVVDTGSTDATMEVARRHTPNVYEFGWIQDFSAARQFAFDCAQGEWIAWLDADDVVCGAGQIRALVASAPPDVGEIYWPYLYAWDEYDNPTCQFWRERLVRNDGSYRWHGRVHEVLTSSSAWKPQYSTDVVVEHRPPPRALDHTKRNLEILEAEYGARQTAAPPRLLFYLAREYAAAGQYEQALTTFAEHLERCTWDDERYQALLNVASIQLTLREVEAAIDTLLQALKICPHWPDAYFTLARAYYDRADWHKVVHWTEMGRAMPRPDTRLFINPMDYSFNWIIYYTNALYHLGEPQTALDWTRRALQICPGDSWHSQNLTFFRHAAVAARLASRRACNSM